MKLWLDRICVVVGLLLLLVVFPGCVVADPTPSGSGGRVFPLEIFDYPEMPASKVHYEAGGDGFDEYVGFATPEGLSCRVVNGGYHDGADCDGHYEEYIPWNTYVKYIHDFTVDRSPGKCLSYTIQAYSVDPGADAHISFDGDVDCHEKIWETGRLDPGYKVTFAGNVCGLTKDHVLACAAYNAHGFVLKPQHKSWAY